MDTEIHEKLRFLLRAAVLLGAVLGGGLLSMVVEAPADVRAWVGAAVAVALGALVGRAYRLVRRSSPGDAGSG